MKIKFVGIALVCLMALAPFMLLASAATTNFGQTAKGGNIAWQPGTVMVASKFTATSTGAANSISVYIYNPSVSSNNYAKCAIYRDSDKALLGTTEQLSISKGFNGWKTFNFASGPTLSSGSSYSLVVWFQSSGNHLYYTSGSSRQSWYGFDSDGSFHSSYSDCVVGQENNVYSIYCTMGSSSSSGSTTTTTSSSGSSSSSYSGTNLVPIPSGWWIDRTGQYLDYGVTYNGMPSIRLDPTWYSSNNPARECNSRDISVRPGNHVVFTCWIKTTASGYGDSNLYSGARIGIDFYDSGGRITALQCPTWPNSVQGELNNYVHWGTTTWVQRTIDFIVPQTMVADGGYLGASQSAGGVHTPTGMILWMQVWGSYGPSDPGQAWFANPQCYVY